MISDRFSILVGLRVIGILVSAFLFAFLWNSYNLPFTFSLLLLVVIVQVVELIYFVNTSNRELKKFLEAIKYEDYSVTFTSKKLGQTFGNLNQSFAALIEKLKENRARQQSHTELLNLVLEHVKIGVLVIDESGNVVLMNTPACEMLEIPHFHNWEMFERKKPDFTKHLGKFDFAGRKLIKLGAKEFYLDLENLSLLGQSYHLISFADLKNEIEIKEIEAWHKLILILAHEVMNSVTPISSLSETANKMLSTDENTALPVEEVTSEKIEDLREALQTIVRRSRGMLSFVDEYRKLTKLPAPSMEVLNIKELFNDVCMLMQPQAAEKNITLELHVAQPRLGIKADRKMIEQVLINLVGNSIYALEKVKDGHIFLKASPGENHTTIEVIDNGKGISKDILPSVFIPFFSTRKNGSGIGLTLSKNIMKLHKGSINVESTEGEGTRFKLSFEN